MINKSIFLSLVLSSLFSTCPVYKEYHYTAIEGLLIGNGLTFHPKEKLILISRPSDKSDDDGKPIYSIYILHWHKNKWQEIGTEPFVDEYHNYHPVFNENGTYLYYNSNRPIPGKINTSEKINIWRIQYENGSWGNPEYLENINSENHESYPSLSSGQIYYNSDRPGGKGLMDIYKTSEVSISDKKNIPLFAINSDQSENDLFIAQDGKFILFNRYNPYDNELDLYISAQEDGSWQEPKFIEEINNKGVWELTPTISPDEKYLFLEIEGRIVKYDLEKIVNKYVND